MGRVPEMPGSAEALLIALLLMPGCFGYFAFTRIYNGKISDSFDKTVSVIVINITSIGVYTIFRSTAGLRFILPSATDFPTLVQQSGIALISLSVISVTVGAAAATAANSRTISGWIRDAGITRRGHQPAIITATIAEYPDAFLKFRFKSGGYVIGHPRFYSLHGEECCIFLCKAARRAPKAASGGQPAEYSVEHGILLLNFDDVLCVEVL